MDKNKKESYELAISRCKEEIAKYNKKTFKVMFFVYDTKGVPSGSLTYIYKTAFALKQEGYNVLILHNENEFVGVKEWLGEKYALLPHLAMGKDSLSVSASDILFIPEVYSNVMSETKNLPCQRIVIMQNFDLMTEILPFGISWANYKIDTFVTTSEKLANRTNEVFRNMKYYVVPPVVSSEFNYNEPKDKLIVGIITKDKADINTIIKPFKLKYPMYGFVSFKQLANMSKDNFAEKMKECAITVWNDPFTDFGISALEAMACGNIVIGKIPESEPEWMFDEKGIKDNGLWYYNTRDAHMLIAKAVNSYLYNEIPNEIIDKMHNTVSQYSEENFEKNVKEVYINQIFKERESELRKTLDRLITDSEKLNNEE